MFTFTLLELFIIFCTGFTALTAYDLLKNAIIDSREENDR